MDATNTTGRTLVLVVIGTLLSASLLVILLFVAARGGERLPMQGLRFVFTAVLCLFLYRGRNWARLVLGALTTLGGMLSLVMVLALLGQPNMVMPAVLGVVYLGCAGILLLSDAVREYCRPSPPSPGAAG